MKVQFINWKPGLPPVKMIKLIKKHTIHDSLPAAHAVLQRFLAGECVEFEFVDNEEGRKFLNELPLKFIEYSVMEG